MVGYDSYKESDEQWSGKVPAHWPLLPIRAIFEERIEKNDGPKTDFILSVTRDRGIIPYDEKGAVGNNKSEEIERYKLVYPGDFVINKMNVVIGSLGMSKYFGAFSLVYLVYKPRTPNIYIEYFAYIFANESFYKSLIKYCLGIMPLRESLNKLDFKKLRLPVPPIEDQIKIANYLDQQTQIIDRAIAQKERLIELLKERQQIIVQRAVTRGLDESVGFKDSGVDWIGDVPEHWAVKKLKYIASITGGFAFSGSDFKEEGIQLIKISNTYNNKLSLERQPTFLSADFLESHSKWIVSKGDILMSLTGTLGKRDYGYAILLKENDKYLLNQRVAKISSIGEVEAEYILLLLRSNNYLNQLYTLPSGTKQANLSNENVIEIEVAIPPERERREIISELNKSNTKTTQAIHQQTQQIAKLKEYRTVLIDAAVTGKIRVG